jgi:hypothetical protein
MIQARISRRIQARRIRRHPAVESAASALRKVG